MSDKVLVQVEGSRATLIINNPAKRNALDVDILKQLSSAIGALDANPGIKVVILRGEGDKAFCAGYTIDKIDTGGEGSNILQDAFGKLRKTRLPIIGMINGIVVGAGLDLCLNCDIRIAAEDVKFGITAAKLGVLYPYDGIIRLAKTIGIPATKELLYTGRLITTGRAQELGLVNMVVSRNELEQTVSLMAEEIGNNAPLSISGTKKVLNSFLDFETFTPEEKNEFLALHLQAFQSRDFAEGQKAFLEKRKPVFQGI